MFIAHKLSEIERHENSVVTVGTFDGVHLGHRKVVDRVVAQARERQTRSIVVTFEPHPREIVGRGPIKLLATLDERIELFRTTGIDLLLIIEFTYEFSRLTPRAFCEHYLVNELGMIEIVVGHDHMFGRDREAGWKELNEIGGQLGFEVFRESPLVLNDKPVGSSKIREALFRGDVQRACQMLGRPFTHQGKVVRGAGRGALLGFPTANIASDESRKIIPADGVYYVLVDCKGARIPGMLNIGTKPTFHDQHPRTIEVHLFGVGESLYDERLTLHFIQRLRGEQKFASAEELVEQLEKDKADCLKLFEANELVT